jgi:hypothetical protein
MISGAIHSLIARASLSSHARQHFDEHGKRCDEEEVTTPSPAGFMRSVDSPSINSPATTEIPNVTASIGVETEPQRVLGVQLHQLAEYLRRNLFTGRVRLPINVAPVGRRTVINRQGTREKRDLATDAEGSSRSNS